MKSILIFKVICVPTKTAKISTPQKFPRLQYVSVIKVVSFTESVVIMAVHE